ncbi:hypothetical protein D3C76_702830 [compost metagenome]
MQQAVRLMGAVIDDHAGGQGLIVKSFETDVQHFADGVFLDCVQLLDVRGGAPQAHRRVSSLVLFVDQSCHSTASLRSLHSSKRSP